MYIFTIKLQYAMSMFSVPLTSRPTYVDISFISVFYFCVLNISNNVSRYTFSKWNMLQFCESDNL